MLGLLQQLGLGIHGVMATGGQGYDETPVMIAVFALILVGGLFYLCGEHIAWYTCTNVGTNVRTF